ncbi:MAG: FAD-binding oxidoreductase [Thermoleophilia bacterium]|nr:FAD-binding oxidoreductase [Thermoleophilia bacterium]
MPEVAVVGGGVMGASIAYHLAAAGVDDVVLHERGAIGSGPTSRSTAVVRLHYSQPLVVRMAAHGLRVFASFRETVGAVSGFTRTGLLVAAPESERAALERNVAVGRGEGATTELLPAGALVEIEPRLAAEGLAFAFEPEAGYCDPYLVTAGFAEAARRAGVRIEEGSPVKSLSALDAGIVVVAAGPWTPALLAQVGYELPVRAAPTEIGRYRLPGGFGSLPPTVADFSARQLYFVPKPDGVLEVGTLDPEHAERTVDPDECPEGASRETLAAFGDALVSLLPAAAGGHWRGSWSAVYDVTPDWHPAIGHVAEGVIVAAGFSGHGFKLAPAVGAAVAELVRDGRSTSYDLGLLDPGRFARGDLVATTYGYSVLG